jgi:hypothetical protein
MTNLSPFSPTLTETLVCHLSVAAMAHDQQVGRFAASQSSFAFVVLHGIA